MSKTREARTGGPLLEARGVRKAFRIGERLLTVLDDVNMEVRPGELVAVVGASGSGKTTLLQILGTLDAPSSGEVLFRGRRVDNAGDRELSRHRNRHIGFLFQFHHLLPEFTALENVMMPGRIAGLDTADLERRARALLERVDMAHRAGHRSAELSGGEQQRVALARALVMEPDLLLADEPTGNLDSAAGRMVFDLLREMSRSLGLAAVMVTHNMDLAADMDRRLRLADGRLGEGD